MAGLLGVGHMPPFNPAANFVEDPRKAPVSQRALDRPAVKGGRDVPFPDVGLGWGDLINRNWPGHGIRTEKTNPDGLMVRELMDEVTKYGDFTQLTYPNFIHFGNGKPQIENPALLLTNENEPPPVPNPLKYRDLASGPSWIASNSAILTYEVLEDDRFYLEATSGVYPGEFGYTTRILRKYLPFLLKLLPGGINDAAQSRNWIGYVAVTKPLEGTGGERDIVIVFRGTQAKAEWVSNIMTGMVPWSELQVAADGPDIKVEKGFEEIYRRFDSTPGNTISIQGQVHVAVRTLLAKYGVDRSQGAVTSITTTGHSLGGALASMCAFDLAWSKVGRLGDERDGDLIPVTAFTFEAPRVGNKAFADVFATQSALGRDYTEGDDFSNYVPLKSLRVVNLPDVVPREPCFPFSFRFILPSFWWKGGRFLLGSIIGLFIPDARFDWFMGYRHGGREYAVNTDTIWPWAPLENWWPNTVFSWWLSRIGAMHSLQLPLYLIDPVRGERT